MWQTTEIAGRPADILTPESATPYSGAVIYLHGYSGESLRGHVEFTDRLLHAGLPVVCPSGGHSWWLDVPSPEFASGLTPMQYLIQHVTPWIAANWHVEPPSIALLGVSMGAQGALNLAYRHALKYPVVAAISPAIDFDRIYGKGFFVEELFESAEQARQETVALHLHPLNWPKHQFFCSDPLDRNWHDGSLRLASKLISSGVPFERDLETSHGGHGWPYFNQMAATAIDHIVHGLRRV